MMRVRPALLLAMAASLVAGCAGYKLGPTNGMSAGSKTISVRPFVNKTTEPRITEYLAMSLRQQFQRDGTFRLQTSGQADIVVTGEILTFSRVGLSYTTNDVLTPQEYVLRMEARITARDTSTGKTMFDRVVPSNTFLHIGEDLESSERQAMPILADTMARTAVNEMVDGTW